MGFGQNFCRNMAKRSYQYAVRSTYDLFKPAKSSNYSPYEQEKEEKKGWLALYSGKARKSYFSRQGI